MCDGGGCRQRRHSPQTRQCTLAHLKLPVCMPVPGAFFQNYGKAPPGSHPQKFQKCWEVMLPGSSPQTRAPGTRCTNALVLTVGGNVLRCVSDSTPPRDPALFASCDGRGNDAALSDCSLCLCHLPTGVLGPSQINGLCSDLFF